MHSVMIPVVLQSPHKTLLVESISYGFGCAMRRRTSTYLGRDPDIYRRKIVLPESSTFSVVDCLEQRILIQKAPWQKGKTLRSLEHQTRNLVHCTPDQSEMLLSNFRQNLSKMFKKTLRWTQ